MGTVTTNPGGTYAYLWYLINPPVTSGNGTLGIITSTSMTVNAMIMSYTGAGTIQPDAGSVAGGTGSPQQISITPKSSNDWEVGYIQATGALGAIGNVNSSTLDNDSSNNQVSFDSNGPVATGLGTIGITANNVGWGGCVLAIAAAPSSGGLLMSDI